MFSGMYHNSIDSKGRIIIPSKFREGLGIRFMLTKGLDGCLFLFSTEEWDAFVAKMKAAPVSSKEGRAFSRYFFANAVECEPDKQGRLTIPPILRAHAGINKDLVTIGVDTRIEVWSKKSWENYNNRPELDTDSIEAKMESLGI